MGFTLIELLVVIAIIAILAAILFPVFAQARDKARSATCQSNLKQNGSALMMYAQDYDETYPFGEVPNTYNDWLTGKPVVYWAYYANVANPVYPDTLMWANSIQPYAKNNKIFGCPSAVTAYLTEPIVSFTYNGLLHNTTMAAVNQPASLPMVWEGLGKQSSTYVYSSPYLNCGTSATCTYVPTAKGCNSSNPGAPSNLGYFNGFIHGQGVNILYQDGHVKQLNVGPLGSSYYSSGGGWGGTSTPSASRRTQPYKSYGSYGYASGSYAPYYTGDVNFDDYTCHPYMFRPEFDSSKP